MHMCGNSQLTTTLAVLRLPSWSTSGGEAERHVGELATEAGSLGTTGREFLGSSEYVYM